jgi:ubiquinone biosynthesis monooxygenase Coq6
MRAAGAPLRAAAGRALASAAPPAGGTEIVDVAINGGGIVGLALAALLRAGPLTAHLDVVVLDRAFPPAAGGPRPAPAPPPGPARPPASADALRAAGAWAALAPPAAATFHAMQVWSTSPRGSVRYDAHEISRAEMGWVAENSAIAGALARALRAGGAGAALRAGGVASAALPPAGGADGAGALAELELEGGGRLRARLLVGADGAASRVRALADIRALGREYGQRAVVATVALEGGPTATAWQRFLPTGPVALLPVRGGYANAVWSTTPAEAAALEGAGAAEFVRALNAALHAGAAPASARWSPPPRVKERVGPPPRSFPLAARAAGRYVRPRLALVGDAAHTVHPLAGQGVNLGLADAAALAAQVAASVAAGRDLGCPLGLEEGYERPRRRANAAMAAALDGLARAFGGGGGAAGAALRDAGLAAIDATPAARQAIMRYAMFGG